MNRRRVSRRTVLRGLGGLGGVGAASTGALLYSTKPAVAASFSATNVSTTTADGTITEVTIAPSLTVEWSGLDSTPTHVAIELVVSGANDPALSGTRTISKTYGIVKSNRASSGTKSISMSTYDLTSNKSGPFTDGDFEATTSGSTTTRTLTLDLTVDVTNNSGVLASDSAADVTFDVTVNNG